MKIANAMGLALAFEELASIPVEWFISCHEESYVITDAYLYPDIIQKGSNLEATIRAAIADYRRMDDAQSNQLTDLLQRSLEQVKRMNKDFKHDPVRNHSFNNTLLP